MSLIEKLIYRNLECIYFLILTNVDLIKQSIGPWFICKVERDLGFAIFINGIIYKLYLTSLQVVVYYTSGLLSTIYVYIIFLPCAMQYMNWRGTLRPAARHAAKEAEKLIAMLVPLHHLDRL